MNTLTTRFFKIMLRSIAVIACVIAGQNAAFAQLSLSIASTDASALPLVSAQVKALKNGNSLLLTEQNFFIVEDNRYTRAASISAPDGAGVQTVKWYSQLRSFNQVKLILSDGSALATAGTTVGTLPFLAFFQFQGQEKRITELKFGKVAAGLSATQTSRIKIQDGNGSNLKIDSVGSGSQFFKAKWIGGYGVPKNLPGDLVPGLPAEIEITFTPAEDKYYQDFVTIYYEGGATDRLAVYGNTIELEEKTVLQLLSPNGGEKLAPCNEFPIRWTGSVQAFPTIIEYSRNNGESWKFIDSVRDTVYMWKVPDDVSDQVLVRVRQEFQRSAEGVLNSEKSEAHALGFKPDGKAFLSAHANGKITEWDTQNFDKLKDFDLSPTGTKVVIAGVGYGKDGTVAAAYSQSFGDQRSSVLAIFKTGETSAGIEKNLPATFPLKKMLTDVQSRFFAMIPDLGREILLYDEAGNLFKTIVFTAPVTGANLSQDGTTAIVSLLNGAIEFYNLPDFSKRSVTDLSALPIIQQATLSPDASLLAVATQRPSGISVSRESEIYIIEVATNNIIRHLVSPKSALFSEAKALSFNATGRALVIGYASNPKVSLWSFSKEDQTAPYSDYSDLSLNLSGELTDVGFGADGRFAIASAMSASSGNLIYRRFSYPETDASNAVFRIVPPIATTTPPTIPNTYLGNRTDFTAVNILCNTGEGPLILDSAVFKVAQFFGHATPFLKDTLMPGECLSLPLVFMPRDTGMLYDTLVIATCSRTFTVAFQAYSIPRNIGLTADTDFGELCVGAATQRELAFLKNNDPAPLTINSLTVFDAFSSSFTILTQIKDTILQPGESLAVVIQFKPKKLGVEQREIIIKYADQQIITSRITLTGRGAGADIQTVTALPFIPEILTRKIAFKNNSPNTVTVVKAELDQPQFTVLTQIPFDIPANSEGNIEIAWSGAPTGDVLLKVETTPCGAEKTIILREFKATGTLSAPTVEADARATDVQIPVSFKSNENTAYAGARFFEAEVMVNPRMFLADSVISEFGTATFTQEVVNGKRVIRIRVEGDFKNEGVAAVIHGMAGLAETLESPIEFGTGSAFFGRSVQLSAQPGLLKITGAGSRRVIQPNITLQLMAVYPNPAREDISIEINSDVNSSATLEIYNALGEKMVETATELLKGISEARMNVAQLPAGTYRVVVKAPGALPSSTILNIAR